MKWKICLLALLWPFIDAVAQSSKLEITPANLEIGDTVPAQFWSLPLQVVNHPDGEGTIQLNDYKGKLIILDFWATWCGSCIASMPNLHALQRQFEKAIVVLPVTAEQKNAVVAFTQKNILLKELQPLYSVVGDEILRKMFPSRTIPHTVVIDGKGILRAVTLPSYLSKENISDLLKGGAPYLPLKRETVDRPLLSLTYSDARVHGPVWYSAIVPFSEGLMFPTGFRRDSTKGTSRLYFINYPLLKLYAFALRAGPLAYTPNRRILAMKNPAAFEYIDKRNPAYDHEKMNYSYEAILPLSFTEREARQRMESDLEAFFKLRGRIEKRKMSCLILVRNDRLEHPTFAAKGARRLTVFSGVLQTRIPEKVGSASNGATTYVRNTGFRDIVYILNHLKEGALPPIIDETGYDGPVDLDLPDDLDNLQLLKKMLQKQGLDLVKEVREIEMFVLSEVGRAVPENAELTLTKFGYVPTPLMSGSKTTFESAGDGNMVPLDTN